MQPRCLHCGGTVRRRTCETEDLTVRPVPLTNVTIDDVFWAPRLETNRHATLPAVYARLEETGRVDALRMTWTPDDRPVPHIFWESDVAKWLEGACLALAAGPDRALRKRVDKVVRLLIGAQQPDGYLNVYFSLVEPDKRWVNLRDAHELYCAGHLIEAAVAHHAATGKPRLLDAMVRYADLIGSTFGRGRGKACGYPGHEEIELALVKLYRATGDRRHLNLARYFIDERGRRPHYFDQEARARGDEPSDSPDPYAYCQAHQPVREQSEAVGHAVRAMYLYSAMADLALETGDAALRDASRRLWDSAVGRKMYVTGGFGARTAGEAFGDDYELPNESAYAETCAAIGLVFWAHRMLHLQPHGRYADALERALYNGALAGVSLDGTEFFYVNPLASAGRHHRQAWFKCACCPTNVARFLAGVSGYMYSAAERELYVHLYSAGRGRAVVAGETVSFEQATEYPWSGDVTLTLGGERSVRFTLCLRIPGWCSDAEARVNGRRAPFRVANGYARLVRTWAPGDTVDLSLAMPVRLVRAHPLVAACAGKVALQRGPLVYCLEQADHLADVRSIHLSARPRITAQPDLGLLGGVTTLRGGGFAPARPAPTDRLYPSGPPARTPVRLKAIPYYAWANRASGPMVVWIPQAGK
jgi:hypothetical protein